MLNPKNFSKTIYVIAGIFLIYSSYNYFLLGDYWQLFINFEFMLMLIYMNFYYKKNPLKLTNVSLLFLLMHFIGYGIHGILTQIVWQAIIALIYIIGYIIYRYIRKQKKYPIYFNPKIK